MESRRAPFSLDQRTYNTISYLGAAVVMLIFGEFGSSASTSIGALWVFHFARRTVESLVVHRYGGRWIPPSDYLLEYLYYWGFGFWIAKGLDDGGEISSIRLVVGLVIFAIGQVGNTWAHLKLRSMRPSSGIKEKAFPEGGLFSLVACPHYLFEIVTWAGFALAANTWGALAYFVLATGILASYARERHQNYREKFDGKDGRPLYPASRRALIPGIY